MATGYKAKAVRRDTDLVVPDIEGYLADEDPYQAFIRGVRALTSELKKVRSRRPAAGALLDAQLAGWLAGTAAGLHSCQPPRRGGRRTGMPGADQLRETFWAAYLQVTGDDDD